MIVGKSKNKRDKYVWKYKKITVFPGGGGEGVGERRGANLLKRSFRLTFESDPIKTI